jgi:hypothetical protein
MRAKYQPLAACLAALPADVTRITLSLHQIEVLLGAPLPPSARSRAFWTNARSAWGGTVQARAWRQAGWRVVTFDYRAATVTFTRAASTP